MSDLSDVRVKIPVIELGGKQYTLRYDFNAWAELEEKYGSLAAAIGELQKAQDENSKVITTVRFMLWVGIHQDMPAISEKEVGRMLKPNDMGKVMEAINGAIEVSMPKDENPDAPEDATRGE